MAGICLGVSTWRNTDQTAFCCASKNCLWYANLKDYKSLGMSISPVITLGAGLGSWFFIVLILHNQKKYRQSERNSQYVC
jgi:hypothetical protein